MTGPDLRIDRPLAIIIASDQTETSPPELDQDSST
jgi:hypothetical protein